MTSLLVCEPQGIDCRFASAIRSKYLAATVTDAGFAYAAEKPGFVNLSLFAAMTTVGLHRNGYTHTVGGHVRIESAHSFNLSVLFEGQFSLERLDVSGDSPPYCNTFHFDGIR